jgi:hypothetical protein
MSTSTDLPTLHNKTGFDTYSPFVPGQRVFFRSGDRETKVITIASGQVLKAHSFLQTNSAGKAIAHTGFNESAIATFSALTVGQTSIAGGITFTSGSAGTTAVQLALAWATIATGDLATAATTKIAAAGITAAMGTFTSGTFTGWETEAGTTTNTVVFNSAASGTNPTDLAFTGTGTAPSLSIVQGATSFPTIAGITAYDVDASVGDIDSSAYIDASFMANALVWEVNPAVDKILAADGTTLVSCTAYNTGCSGTSKASNLLKQKFVEGSEFANLGFIDAGAIL